MLAIFSIKKLISQAFGAIVSFCIAQDVGYLRVVDCDAAVFDRGIVRPQDLLGNQRICGRGGTVLQSAIDFLDAAQDFPKEAPLLIVTDGAIDDIRCTRTYALLTPKGARMTHGVQGTVIELR